MTNHPFFQSAIRLLVGLVIALSLFAPLHVSAATPTCQVGGASATGTVRLNPAGISDCLEEGHAGESFSWVISTWKWSLSVVNIFAVMVLVFMAFANILYPWKTLEPYRIRQLLPSFIAGIVLANASLLIVRALTNVSDILMNTPELIPTAEKIWQGWGLHIDRLSGIGNTGLIQAVYGDGGLSLTAGGMIYQFFLSMILVYLPVLALFLLSILFYVRFAVIFVLTAVAPIAFGSIIFPATKKFLNSWWDLFWKWTFGGVIAYLMMFLAIQVKGAGIVPVTGVGGGAYSWVTGLPSPKDVNNLAINFIPYGISLALFFAALVAPFKMGNFMTSIASIPGQLGNRAKNFGINSTKFLGRKGVGLAWGGYGTLMAHAKGWDNPTKGQGQKLDQAWRTRPRTDLRKYLAGAGILTGRVASKFNLYNARELIQAKLTDMERVRKEASWESRSAQWIAGDEPTFRYWRTQNKGKYDSYDIPGLVATRKEKEVKYGLSSTFFKDLAERDPKIFAKFKGTNGERFRAAAKNIYVDGQGNFVSVDPNTGPPPPGAKSILDVYKQKGKIEDLADTSDIVSLQSSRSEMLGKDKHKDDLTIATDDAVNEIAATLPDISATTLEEAIKDALRTAANQVVLRTPVGGIAPNAPLGVLGTAILDRLNVGRGGVGQPSQVTLDQKTMDRFNQYETKVKNSIDKIHDDTKTRIQHNAGVATGSAEQRTYKDMALAAHHAIQREYLGGGATAPDLSNLVSNQVNLVNQLKEMEIKLSHAKDNEEKSQIFNTTFTTSITNGMAKTTKDDVDATIAKLTKGAHALEYYTNQALFKAPTNGVTAAQQLADELK